MKKTTDFASAFAYYRFILYSLPYSVDIEACTRRQLLTLITEDERRRYERIVACDKQSEFLLSRALLRRVAGLLLNAEPAHLHFARTDYGKPYLEEGNWSVPTFFFNLSHAEEHILLAITRYGEIGVDVESIGEYRRNIAKRFFHHDEYQKLEHLDPARRADAFYQIWTIKEACVKALGFGLQFPLREIYVSSDGDDMYHERGNCQGLSWQTLQAASAYKAAVALRLEDNYTVPRASQTHTLDVDWLLSGS